MVEKQSIIHLFKVGKMSVRGIARKLKMHRKTVSKILTEYESALASGETERIEEILTTPPSYDSSKRRRRVVVKEVSDIMDELFEMNQKRRFMGLRKQCMCKRDVWEYLRKRGISIAYSTVCRYLYVKEHQTIKKHHSTEAFIRQEYAPGEMCEFDWGQIKLTIAGSLRTLHMAVFTFSYSNGRAAYLFDRENSLAFMEAHRNFFKDIKGVPGTMVYDNMRVAVEKFVGKEKKPTVTLLRLSNFYGYSFRFCNVRSGNEKGHVERSVEFVRRKSFCIIDSFASVEHAQRYLSMVCAKLNSEPHSPATEDIKTRYAEDLAALSPHTDDMGCFEMKDFKVDKWSTITLSGSHYSVPDSCVGQTVAVRMFSGKLQMVHIGEVVAEHERLYKPGWSIKLEHYLHTLGMKPGAVASSTALIQAPEEVRTIFRESFKGRESEFISLLLYMHEKGFTQQDMYTAYRHLKTKGIGRVSSDQIKALLCSRGKTLPEKGSLADVNNEIEKGAEQTLARLTTLMNQVLN